MDFDDRIFDPSLSEGGKLAAAVGEFYLRFLSLPTPAKALLPIWTLHTYVFEEFEFTPYLNVLSPEPGCGKTTAGDILSALCCRATTPLSGSAAVLRRRIATGRPTLILDEWDSLDAGTRKACSNFLNTGYRRDGTYELMVGSQLVSLSTYCPKAIIGRKNVVLHEATLSRCISFTMQRALPAERLEKFRAAHREDAEGLRQECEAWAREFRSRQAVVPPLIPESFSARQQDISEPLLAIADACGGPWPWIVREALSDLFEERHLKTPESELLAAVYRFIDEREKPEFFRSCDFCAWANAQEEPPWSDSPLTPAKLAEMLRCYDIFPAQINRVVDGKQRNCRGYYIKQFEEPFARYVPPER